MRARRQMRRTSMVQLSGRVVWMTGGKYGGVGMRWDDMGREADGGEGLGWGESHCQRAGGARECRWSVALSNATVLRTVTPASGWGTGQPSNEGWSGQRQRYRSVMIKGAGRSVRERRKDDAFRPS